MPGLTDEQQKLYCQLESVINNNGNVAEILQEVSKEDLLAVLTAADIHVKTLDNAKITVTPLGFAVVLAIYSNDQKNIKVILDAAIGQGILKKVLTAANIHTKFSNGMERTVTPLGFTIQSNHESIKTILDAAIGQGILKKVLTTANMTVKLSDGMEYTVTPLGLAIILDRQQSIKAILDAAIGQGILKEVFAGIEKDNRGKIKTILKEAGNQNVLDKISQVEKDISDNRAAKGNSTSDESATTEQATNKAIMIGIVCGVITGLAVGIGCGVANVGLSMLVIASIAVIAALAVSGTTYMLSKPSTKVDETKVNGNVQEVLV